MKVKIIFAITLCIVILSNIFIISCSEENEPIKVMVISNGGSFSGYYLKDADTITPFLPSLNTGNMFIYNKEIEIEDNIEVSVTTEATATSVEIKIYRDKNLVKSVSQTGDGTTSIDASLVYTLGEENNITPTSSE